MSVFTVSASSSPRYRVRRLVSGREYSRVFRDESQARAFDAELAERARAAKAQRSSPSGVTPSYALIHTHAGTLMRVGSSWYLASELFALPVSAPAEHLVDGAFASARYLSHGHHLTMVPGSLVPGSRPALPAPAPAFVKAPEAPTTPPAFVKAPEAPPAHALVEPASAIAEAFKAELRVAIAETPEAPPAPAFVKAPEAPPAPALVEPAPDVVKTPEAPTAPAIAEAPKAEPRVATAEAPKAPPAHALPPSVNGSSVSGYVRIIEGRRGGFLDLRSDETGKRFACLGVPAPVVTSLGLTNGCLISGRTVDGRDSRGTVRRYLTDVVLVQRPQNNSSENKGDASNSSQTCTSMSIDAMQTWLAEERKAAKPTNVPLDNRLMELSFGEVADQYLAHCRQKQNLKSYSQNERQLNWWRRWLAEWPIQSIHPRVIAKLRDMLADSRVSHSTRNNYMATLSAMYTFAMRHLFVVGANVTSMLQKGRPANERTRFLDDDERYRLTVAIRHSFSPFLMPAYLVCLTTGMRKGECTGLLWEHVHLDHTDPSRSFIELKKTKNSKPRAIPLPYVVHQVLVDLKKKNLSDKQVFPNAGAGPYDPRAAFATACARAGIQNFNWHDLRHCAGSYLAMSGATQREIMAVLGHLDIATSARYVHLDIGHLREVLERCTAEFPALRDVELDAQLLRSAAGPNTSAPAVSPAPDGASPSLKPSNTSAPAVSPTSPTRVIRRRSADKNSGSKSDLMTY